MPCRGWYGTLVGRRPGQGVQILKVFTIMVFISIGFVYKHSDWVPTSLSGLQRYTGCPRQRLIHISTIAHGYSGLQIVLY